MRNLAAAARRPSFDILEVRSLLSGSGVMPAWSVLPLAPDGESLYRGSGAVSSGPMPGASLAPREAWNPPSDGMDSVTNPWSGSGLAPGMVGSWQPASGQPLPGAWGPYGQNERDPAAPNGANASPSGGVSSLAPSGQDWLNPGGWGPSIPGDGSHSTSTGDSASASATSPPSASPGGNPGSTFQPSGQSLVEPTSQGSPTAPPSSSPAPADNALGGTPQTQGISPALTIAAGANAPEIGSGTFGAPGSVQAGVGPLQEPSSLTLAGVAGSSARIALQVEASGNGMAGVPPAFRATSPGFPATSRVRQAGTRTAERAERNLGVEKENPLPPASADLFAGMVTFDRAAIERAIDRFLEKFDDRSARQLLRPGPGRIILVSTALAGSALALEAMRRRWRHDSIGGMVRVRSRNRREDLLGFPELPGRWTSRLT